MRYMYNSDSLFDLIDNTMDAIGDQLDAIGDQLDKICVRYDKPSPARPKRKRTIKKKVVEQPKEPEIPEIEKSDAGKLADKFTELLEGKKAKARRQELPRGRTILG